MNAELIMLSGIPASGKSTLVRKMVKANPTRSVIVNRDSIRNMLGDYWVPSREDLVTDIEDHAIRAGLEKNYIVIVDATNLNSKTINRLEATAEEYKAKFFTINCPISLNKAIWRDFWRGFFGGRRVGVKVIKSFYNRL